MPMPIRYWYRNRHLVCSLNTSFHQQGISKPAARATHSIRSSPCQSYAKQHASGTPACPQSPPQVLPSLYFESAYFFAKSLSEGMTTFKVCMSCIIAMCAFSFTSSSGTFLRQQSHPHPLRNNESSIKIARRAMKTHDDHICQSQTAHTKSHHRRQSQSKVTGRNP